MHKRFRRLPRSIFTKLLVVILVAGVCLNITVGAFFHNVYRKLANSPLKRNLAQYVHLLVEEIGSPPDMEKARRLSSEAGLRIWYRGAGQQWSTHSESAPRFDWKHSPRFMSKTAAIRYARHHGNFYVSYRGQEGGFIFRLADPEVEAEDVVKGAVFILLALSLTLGLVFFLVRRLLKPVDHLTLGVHQVAAGQLDHQVPETGVDEFAQLAGAFNQMTGRIKDALEAREQLLLDVSHELRSPITRIRVAMEFLPESRAKSSMVEDVTVLEELVGQILEGARARHRAGQLKLVSLDLAVAARTAVDAVKGREPGIKISIPEGVWTVQADEAKVQTVLNNLLENALKYSTPDSGPVRVTLRRADKGVEVLVMDQGIGIPAEDLDHILEPFYRVDKSRTKATGGYGLGLSLCHTIMQAHGGRITITSQPDMGTQVTLLFPETVKAGA